MSDIELLFNDVKKLNHEIRNVLSRSGYEHYDDLSGLTIDYKDPEQLLLMDELRSILEHLNKVKDSVEYLSMPIAHQGILRKNSRGRYQTDRKEFTCGQGIEALIKDGYHDSEYWAASRIEHDGKDYYLVGYPGIQLEGLSVRTR